MNDLVTMVKVDGADAVVDINRREDFLRTFREFPNSAKTLMLFREHQPGVETLPEPIDWLNPDLSPTNRGYVPGRADDGSQ